MTTYDYIIIGAGPAGCFSAAMLAQKGYDVCILEKNSKGYRKVCGDGISVRATDVLKKAGFPMEKLLSAGAVKIDSVYTMRDNEKKFFSLKENGLTAFALSRDKTDSLFREYCQEQGAEIHYNIKASEIERIEDGFSICGFKARNAVIATGAAGNIFLDGKKILPSAEKPIGVSMIVKGKTSSENFYFFDYAEEYGGTYSWIFTLGNDLYNIGLWLKTDKKRLKEYFDSFCRNRAVQICGDFETVCPARYSVMGIGKKVECDEKGIYILGDAANTSSSDDGEGISSAIISAAEFAEKTDVKRWEYAYKV